MVAAILICYLAFKLSTQFSHLAPREMWLPGGRQDAPPNLASLSSVVSTAEAQDEEDMTASNLDIEVGGVKLHSMNWHKWKNYDI